jgi:hypothetical protein
MRASMSARLNPGLASAKTPVPRLRDKLPIRDGVCSLGVARHAPPSRLCPTHAAPCTIPGLRSPSAHLGMHLCDAPAPPTSEHIFPFPWERLLDFLQAPRSAEARGRGALAVEEMGICPAQKPSWTGAVTSCSGMFPGRVALRAQGLFRGGRLEVLSCSTGEVGTSSAGQVSPVGVSRTIRSAGPSSFVLVNMHAPLLLVSITVSNPLLSTSPVSGPLAGSGVSDGPFLGLSRLPRFCTSSSTCSSTVYAGQFHIWRMHRGHIGT